MISYSIYYQVVFIETNNQFFNNKITKFKMETIKTGESQSNNAAKIPKT